MLFTHTGVSQPEANPAADQLHAKSRTLRIRGRERAGMGEGGGGHVAHGASGVSKLSISRLLLTRVEIVRLEKLCKRVASERHGGAMSEDGRRR